MSKYVVLHLREQLRLRLRVSALLFLLAELVFKVEMFQDGPMKDFDKSLAIVREL